MKNWIDNVKWTDDGLVPVIVQDHISNKVIMFAWMNRLSLEASLKQKKAIYWSRSRNKIWTKGESSGYYQYIKDMIIDCDKDVVLIKERPEIIKQELNTEIIIQEERNNLAYLSPKQIIIEKQEPNYNLAALTYVMPESLIMNEDKDYLTFRSFIAQSVNKRVFKKKFIG